MTGPMLEPNEWIGSDLKPKGMEMNQASGRQEKTPLVPAPVYGLRHFTPAFRIFAGTNALDALPDELARCKVTKVLLICSGSAMRHEPTMVRMRGLLGSRLAGVFAEVQRHSPAPVVEMARDQILGVSADGVVVLGGGSAIVTARAACVLAGERRVIGELATYRDANGRAVNPRMSAPKIPQWIVPSTPIPAYAKTGAALLDSGGHRVAIYDPKARAQGVFLDPVIAATAPASLVRSAAMNAFSMAVEGLLSSRNDPLAEALFAQALRDFATCLPHVREDGSDSDLRVRVMLASLMAGQGSDFTGGGLLLSLSHAIGPRCGLPNGLVEAPLIPHVLRFVSAAVSDRLPVVADAFGLSRGAGIGEICDAVYSFVRCLNLPVRLRDLDIPQQVLDGAPEHAAHDWANTPRLPRQANAEQFKAILSNAW